MSESMTPSEVIVSWKYLTFHKGHYFKIGLLHCWVMGVGYWVIGVECWVMMNGDEWVRGVECWVIRNCDNNRWGLAGTFYMLTIAIAVAIP